jgi:transposase
VAAVLRHWPASQASWPPTWRGILARVRWPMHTGQLEGINNRIKVMKRMAYGYRDSAYFFLKIMAAYPGNP